LESQREELIKKLLNSNEELERFAYVISHDLREPVRMIVGFIDLLTKEYADRIDGAGKEYMFISKQASKKMEAMIIDLLEYANFEQQSDRLKEVNCNHELKYVLEVLRENIQSTHATIHLEPLPKIMANPVRFVRLMQNLIGNALKYQTLENSPIIHVAAEDKGKHWQFAVTDNGIGIKTEYLESIFLPFKRLHRENEYGGTGIGLAICKKIVESFGGNIWVKSTFGQGSTFFFTVPKSQQN